AAEVIDWNHRVQHKFLGEEQVRIDWLRLMQFKRSIISGVSKNREDNFSKNGIATFHGRARFTGPLSVQVGDDLLGAAKVVVAAGSEPADLNITGAEHVLTSEQFLELDAIPRRILFIGRLHFIRIRARRCACWRQRDNPASWRETSGSLRPGLSRSISGQDRRAWHRGAAPCRSKQY